MNGRIRLGTDQERGAVAVLVALLATVLFGFTAFAIDAGNLWQTRRNMVTATDAAALAAAQKYALGDNGCDTAAQQYLSANRVDATMTACNPVVKSSRAGYVTVQGVTNAKLSFAGILGMDNKDVHSATTANWFEPSSVTGLRPLGLCLDGNDAFKTWLNLPSGPTGTSAPITITYGKDQPLACGGAPGNWGVIDFDGGSNSNSDTKAWILRGYDGEVAISAPLGQDPTRSTWQLGDTGAYSNSISTELQALVDSGEQFALPVFDVVEAQGSNAVFHIVAFVSVKLVAYNTTGSTSSNDPATGRSLTLVFGDGIVHGKCCQNTGIDTGVRAVHICDVDTLTPDATDPRGC